MATPVPQRAPRPSGPGGRPRLSRAARRRRRGRRLARVLLVAVLAVLVGTTTFIGGLLAAPVDFDKDILPEQRSVLLQDSDGRQFASITPPTRRKRVPAGEIPPVMREAIISAEDERFLEHDGVDPLAVIRAAYRDVTGGRRQGGSTLTQQYVKNAYVGSDATLLRKVREAALAVRLEDRKTKDEILTDYLNALYLGNGVYGVEAAAQYYFGVPVRHLAKRPDGDPKRDLDLELARASLLAGIAPAPSAWNPVRDPDTARARQKYTLNRMVVAGFIDSEQADRALKKDVDPLRITPPEPKTDAPEFADLVKTQLREKFQDDEDVLFRGGLRVRTTLDSDLQAAVSRAAREVLPDDDDPQAAVVAIDIRNGDVKAMTTLRRVPARSFAPDDDGRTRPDRPATSGYVRNGTNLATSAYRSTGSTIKPFTLARALEEGRDLSSTRYAPSCAPYRDTSERGRYCNAEASENGTYTLRRALAQSINTVYVPLADEVGHGDVRQLMLDSGVVAADGLDEDEEPLDPAPESFGLGTTALVTPLSMANAYGTLANHGVRVPPRYFTDIRTTAGAGNPAMVVDTEPATPEGERVMPVDVADRVVTAMRDVVTRGTGTAAAQEFEVFGKTGTTNDSKDAWFIGCARSPQNICLAVWMGYEDGTCAGVQGRACGGMKNVNGVPQVYGGTLPAKIFSQTFVQLRALQAAREAPPAPPSPPSSPTREPAAEPSATPAD